MGNNNSCCENPRNLLEAETVVRSPSAANPPSLVPAQPRLSTIPESTDSKGDTAQSDEETEAHDAELRKKLERKHQAGKKKMGISAEAYGQFNQAKDFVPPVIVKSEEQTAQIRATLAQSFMFNGLEEKDQRIVIDAMQIKRFGAGEAVIRQGDQGNELYIVASGALRCEKVFPGNTAATFLKNYGPKEVFGELSLLYNTPRAASIISSGDSVLFSLDRETFNHIVKTSAMRRREKYEDFLKKVEILKGLDDYDRTRLCDVLKTETFLKDQYIIRQGDEADKFYILQEGLVETFKKVGDGPEKLVYTFKENDYFGELALIHDDKRQASCRVASAKAVVVSLDKESFQRLLGGIKQTLQEQTKRYK